MSNKRAAKDKTPRLQRPVDLKYGQTALMAGEYQCSRCGQIHIFGREDVAGPCRECGGHFYFAIIHQRR
jgi:hypothetical protein